MLVGARYRCNDVRQGEHLSSMASMQAGLTNTLGFLAEKLATVRSGFLSYARHHSGSFEIAGVHEKLSTL
jgi:hypothetical protein